MNDQRRWSGSGIVAGIVGGLALLVFLLVAGFAGERLADVDEPGWAALVALLTTCGAVFLLCLVWGWRQCRKLLAHAVPGSAAAINVERTWRGVVMSLAVMLTYGLPPVLVRQTYWSWAPWSALVSFVVCLSTVVVALRRSHQLTDAYYAQLSPEELRRELDRLQSGMSYTTLKRLWLALGGLVVLSVVFLLTGAVIQWMDQGIVFPLRTARGWSQLINPFNLLFIGAANWSNVRLIERWRQRLPAQADA